VKGRRDDKKEKKEAEKTEEKKWFDPIEQGGILFSFFLFQFWWNSEFTLY
jgi:hypothetical protein